jgi:hypothetical protein
MLWGQPGTKSYWAEVRPFPPEFYSTFTRLLMASKGNSARLFLMEIDLGPVTHPGPLVRGAKDDGFLALKH